MFWSGNYVYGKDLKSLLQEENVTLKQVLEASEILTECKANNPALVQYLTRPDILSELIAMITEEPPKELDKQLQYRYANIACEVLTSHIATLKDKLSSDPALMSRLCDFVEQEPPLNPLLASFFSRMLEMLLAKNFKEDWCLYNIVCLRVLDVLQARDFLPSLLRHLATSAAADALLLLMRLEDALHDTVTAWLKRDNVLDHLVALLCGAHEDPSLDARTRRAAADNAMRLLAELIEVPSPDNCEQIRGTVLAVLRSPASMESLLQRTFGGEEGPARVCALTNGGRLLQLLLTSATEPPQRADVERAMAPHLPLLHRALLTPHAGGVGRHRVQLARLVATLVSSEEPTVATALVALGTVDALLDLSRSHPDNCFLRAAAVQAVSDATDNHSHMKLYWNHFFYECDMGTKILDTFEDERTKNKLGHMWSLLLFFQDIDLPRAVLDRYDAMKSALEPTLDRLELPLGGYYPSEKNFEEGEMGGAAPFFESNAEFQEILNKIPQIARDGDEAAASEDGADKYMLYCDTSEDPDDAGNISPWVGDDAAQDAEDEGWARWSDIFPPLDDDDDRRTLTEISLDQQLQMEFASGTAEADYMLWDAPSARSDEFTELASDLLNVMSGMTIADIVSEQQVGVDKTTMPVSECSVSLSSPERTKSSNEQVMPSPERTKSSTEQVTSSPEQVTSSPEQVISSPEQVISSLEHTKSSTDRISSSPEHTKSSTEQITSSTEKVTSSPEHTKSSTDQITSSSEHTKSSTEQVTSSPEHTKSSTDQITSSPEHTKPSTEQVTSSPEHTKSSTDQMTSSPEHTKSSTDQITSSPEFTKSLSDQITSSPKSSTEQVTSSPEHTMSSTDQITSSSEHTTSSTEQVTLSAEVTNLHAEYKKSSDQQTNLKAEHNNLIVEQAKSSAEQVKLQNEIDSLLAEKTKMQTKHENSLQSELNDLLAEHNSLAVYNNLLADPNNSSAEQPNVHIKHNNSPADDIQPSAGLIKSSSDGKCEQVESSLVKHPAESISGYQMSDIDKRV